MYIDKSSIIVNVNDYRNPEYGTLKKNIKRECILKSDEVFIKLATPDVYHKLKKKSLNKLKNIDYILFKRRIYRRDSTTQEDLVMYEEKEMLDSLEDILSYFDLYRYNMIGFEDAAKLTSYEKWWLVHSKIKIVFMNGDEKKVTPEVFIRKYIRPTGEEID